MKSKIYVYMLALSGMMALLAGCGSGGTTPEKTGHALTESLKCIGCHEDSQNPRWVSPGSGKPIVAEWMASTHNTNNGASCKSCHGTDFDNQSLHPISCTKCHTLGGQVLTDSSTNPDRHGRCAKCHDKVNPRPGLSDGFTALTYTNPGIPAGSTTRYTHYSTGQHGTYVSTNYKQYCRKCHNPHDAGVNKKQLKEWAESGHGSTRSLFVTDAAHLKTRGSSLPLKDTFGNVCVRCHTSTGYVKFIKTDPRNGEIFSEVQALPDFDGTKSNYPAIAAGSTTYADKSREGINCNVCHDDGRPDDESAYSGKVRTVAPFSVWYTYSSHPLGVTNTIRAKQNIQFDDLGTSNLCAVCHSGRENGDIIKVADRLGLFDYTGTTNATRPSAISPHDFAAGANLQGKSGFHFYTSAAKYTSNPTHKTSGSRIGGASGSCIGCHMKNAQSHLFEPVTWQDGNLYATILAVPGETTICITCHNATENSPQRSAAFMNVQRDYYRAAQLALATMIPANRDWKFFGNAVVPGSGAGPGYTGGDAIRQGAYTMGASFVSSLLSNDPGAYTHNPTYTKQLIYDSIDWLADGKMDFGAASTQVYNKVNAIATSLTYSKGKPAVIYGQNGIPISAGGVPFTKTQVLNFICKDYDVANPTVCNRW